MSQKRKRYAIALGLVLFVLFSIGGVISRFFSSSSPSSAANVIATGEDYNDNGAFPPNLFKDGEDVPQNVYLDDDVDVVDSSIFHNPNFSIFLVCLFGMLYSLFLFLAEQLHWNPNSFQRFSIATKEIFCCSGPVVLVSFIIYFIMGVLLLMDSNTSSVFFLSTSWSAIILDMTMVCYEHPPLLLETQEDLVLHIINFSIVLASFAQLNFAPFTFVGFGAFFWVMVATIRFQRSGPMSALGANVVQQQPEIGGNPGFFLFPRPGSP